jgi:hypothetical protein
MKLDENLVFPPYNPPSLPPLDRIRHHQNTPTQSEARLKIPPTPTSAATATANFPPSKIPTPTGIAARSTKPVNNTLPSPSGSKPSRVSPKTRRASGSNALPSVGKSTQGAATTSTKTNGHGTSSKKSRKPSAAVPVTSTTMKAQLSNPSTAKTLNGGQRINLDVSASTDSLPSEKTKLREKRDKESHPKGTIPMSPQAALKTFGQCLSQYERTEIVEYPNIYFTAPNAPKKPASTELTGCNFGFDDDRGDYLVVMGDHLYYRYELVDSLGKGSFGQVLKCLDHKTGEHVAVKIIRNKKRFHCQALVEVKILESLNRWVSLCVVRCM